MKNFQHCDSLCVDDPRIPKRQRSSQEELDFLNLTRKVPEQDEGSASDHRHDSSVRTILANLSVEELETAARACYEYVQHPSLQTRDEYASRLVHRYLQSKKGNVELAIIKIRQTLQFRMDYDLEGLMKAFPLEDNANDDHDDNNSNTSKTDPDYATQLHKHLAEKKFHVQGFDKQGRSTLFFIPRRTRGFDKEWHIKEALYSMERAIACSRCSDATINAVVDFAGFSITQHAPPLDIGKEFLTILRSHYAGQIHKIFLLDCPTSFFILWKLLSQFVGTDTRDKIEFISGEASKTKLLSLYDIEEMPPFMCVGGGNVREFNVEEYLWERTFNEAF